MLRPRRQNNSFVISLGGSLIVPDKTDNKFVERFVVLIKKQVKAGDRFFIVTGGGAAARRNIAKLKQSGNTSKSDLDWAGIAATKVNARLIAKAFGKLARNKIITDPSRKEKNLKVVNVASGWKPGHSTDMVAAKLAETYDADTVINLSNIDYVYDKDPRKFKNAKKFTKMTWPQFRSHFGSKWHPGANVPFDPVAARLAQKNQTKVIILNGRNPKNFQNFLANKPFRGTVVS